jgi:hypothetical protein
MIIANNANEAGTLRYDPMTGQYKYLFIRTINPEVSVYTAGKNPLHFFWRFPGHDP